jgi:hypothetical protein
VIGNPVTASIITRFFGNVASLEDIVEHTKPIEHRVALARAEGPLRFSGTPVTFR